MTALMPHCDQMVLHAPGDCKYCDQYASWQSARIMWGINFTGGTDESLLPCPSTLHRTIETINLWSGNRPVKEDG